MFELYFEAIAYLCLTISIIILIIRIDKLCRLIINYCNHFNIIFYNINNNIKDIKGQQTNEINGLARIESKIDTLYKNDEKYYKFVEKVDKAFFNKNMINEEDVAFVGVISKVNKQYKYLFSDLDGTLIETLSGETFPKDENDWKLKTDVIEAIKKLNPEGLYIVSNQGGIEKGYFSEESFENKMINIINSLRKCLPDVKDIQYEYCVTNDKDNVFRKPNAGMIYAIQHRCGISLTEALMIGDASGKEGQFSDSDKKCAENAGMAYMDVEDFINNYK